MTKVFLVGAGPGDPDLLTLKAARLIAAAGVILHDSLAGPRVLALANPKARRIDVGKRCGGRAMPQAEICRLLVEAALAGHVTVRLKGGDPMIFGRATEEMAALQAHGVEFEVVPGISAANAAAAALQTSLTQRGIARTLHFLTGHGAQDGLPAHDWVSLAKSGGTLAVYMGKETLGGLATHLIEAGMSPAMPALAVENVSLPSQRHITGTLATLPSRLAALGTKGPVVVLIGEAIGPGTLPLAVSRKVQSSAV
jgi:uroporphyrin-III C-methyltransferase/precorrin-2 dehydrogenase/sirohydrochlorin ferrochelatase/uroporphyrin-III C-methyltransferase